MTIRKPAQKTINLRDHAQSGNTFAENLMTVAHTARKQQRNVLAFLTACCDATHDDMPPPSLFAAAAV